MRLSDFDIDASATSQKASTTATEGSCTESLPVKDFLWGAGIECSFLPHLNVDQFAWTQHDRFWREDFKLARYELGISTLRYALPWHVLEPQRGKYDWDFADERIAECAKLGIDLVMDVVHFGTPLWLKQAVGDPEFPEALEEFTHRYVSRYASAINKWCPFNEPLVSALFSGDLGFWPPHQRRWRGYMPVLSRVAQATSRAMRAIRSAAPEATIILCDAAESFHSHNAQLAHEVNRRNLRRFIVMDLITGRVDRHHALFNWLTNYGLSELDLEWFRTHPQSPDILGLDYYPHSDWQLDAGGRGEVFQRRADQPAGFASLARDYYNRYGIPMMLTETSIEGMPINREIWLDSNLDEIRSLRESGIPLLGIFWWPLLDQLDWDGALTHRIGKIHHVGLYSLTKQQDGTLRRTVTPLVRQFRAAMNEPNRIGELQHIAVPAESQDPELPPLAASESAAEVELPVPAARSDSKKNGTRVHMDAAPGISGESAAAGLDQAAIAPANGNGQSTSASTERSAYGIIVFSHLRWGFVWQRPQQFLSRFAKKHEVLFVEEPFFDLPEGEESRIQLHRVMPNVTVVALHFPPSAVKWGHLGERLRDLVRQAIKQVNGRGAFDRPLLWYYSPMDSHWTLGHFENRGIVYDSMDELSQFSGAPASLVANEARLMKCADVVFAGGFELAEKKKQRHDNVHFFGCGVEYDHFSLAQDRSLSNPPDVDFMPRPIIGWFGVIDERVDYNLLAEMARLRPNWSFAMVGPIVKMDPNLLPHAPNLYWLGQRDYSVLPQYCRAYDVCMMPFAINAATEYINPTKVLEYLATGRPVISTPVKDVVRQYSDLLEIAKTPLEFVQAIERILANPPAERIAAGIERARKSGWDQTVAQMRDLIAQAIAPAQRKSTQPVPPLTAAEASLSYKSTPGS